MTEIQHYPAFTPPIYNDSMQAIDIEGNPDIFYSVMTPALNSIQDERSMQQIVDEDGIETLSGHSTFGNHFQ